MNPSAPHPHRRRLTRAEVRRRRRSRAIRRVAGLTVMLCVAAGGVTFLLTHHAAIPSASAASAISMPAQSIADSTVSSAENTAAPANALGLTADEARAMLADPLMVLVNHTSKMPDDYMDSIEPYDYTELKPFSTAYLPGFLADKFDVTVEQSRERADKRCENTLAAALRDIVKGYNTCTSKGGSTSLKCGKVHYALMPVWMLNTKWNGKDFLFAMNGQTGRLVGELPVSRGRFWALFAAITVPLSVLSSVLFTLL